MTVRWSGAAVIGVLAAAIVIWGVLAVDALRWHLLLGGVSPYRGLFRLYLIGWYFSLFLPTTVGGDAVRVLGVTRIGVRAGEAVSSVLLDRVVGFVTLIGIFAVGAGAAPWIVARAAEHFEWSLGWIPMSALAITGVAGMVSFVLVGRRVPKVACFLTDAAAVWHRLRVAPGLAGAAIAVSVVGQAGFIAAWLLVSAGLRLDVPVMAFVVFVPLVSVATMLPITVSGLGIREGVWALLMAPFGVPAADAVVCSLLFYVASLAVGGIGGVLFVRSGLRSSRRGHSLSNRASGRLRLGEDRVSSTV
jgi:hypothetical protein